MVCQRSHHLNRTFPTALVAGTAAVVHCDHGRPGVAFTTAILCRRFHWSGLATDARRVLRMPPSHTFRQPASQYPEAPFVAAVGVLEMNLHDVGNTSAAGNRRLL